MTRVKEELIKDLQEKFGPQARPIMEYLFDMETVDDFIAREHVIKIKVFDRMKKDSTTPEYIVHEEVGEEYGTTRETVLRIVRKSYKKAG